MPRLNRLAATVFLAGAVFAGCASPTSTADDRGLALYPHLLRAADPGFTGLGETWDLLAQDGLHELGDYPALLRGGVGGFSEMFGDFPWYTWEDRRQLSTFWALLRH